ncbi:transposase family protein [Clostridium botulinum 202F]|nr:transposase family protein [Clostridium botulinum 202F]KAI3345732.1 transposase [Clostridium botulinum]KON12240.1 hypothetical protein ACP50_09910 [Clostridium botulinum]MBY6985318.1 transposase [Clostridium botulinum]
MNKEKRYDVNLKKIVAEEYKKGKLVKDIARDYNISLSSVYKWKSNKINKNVLQMDFKIDNKQKNKKEDIEYIREISRLRKDYEIILKENEILKKTISVLIK